MTPPRAAVDRTGWDWSGARRQCLREARRLLRSPEDAEEAVQEALVRAWRRRAACQTPEAPMPWMLQITRNESFRLLERRKRLDRSEIADEVTAEAADIDPELENVVGAVATEQALSVLRADERTLIRLRYVEDLSQPAVARKMDMPEGTVKVRLHRIRHRLRAAFEELEEAA